MATSDVEDENGEALGAAYQRSLTEVRLAFEATGDGRAACGLRCAAVDTLVSALWQGESTGDAPGSPGLCLVALGGYGREQLFPFSDVDLLFCADRGSSAEKAKPAIRRVSQALWDSGLKLSPVTRAVADCERFKSADPEFSLALLDLRFVCGDRSVFQSLQTRILDRRTVRETRALATAAAELTRERYTRFGNTLFHLEPNVKEAPGGLRDAHVCGWLGQLRGGSAERSSAFREALDFLIATRTFVHLRHGRDDNTLDWHAQDEAAARGIGLGKRATNGPRADPAYWMRAYFRQARVVQRELARELERSGQQPKPSRDLLKVKAQPRSGFLVEEGVLHLKTARADLDPAHDADIVLRAFELTAETGIALAPGSEERIAEAIPELSRNLEVGPRLWSRLRPILTGPHAAEALREMHALGVLELIVPEFHGIDALVIRDAYHRYTVDEHTFVLLHTLHGLAQEPPRDAPEWRRRFRTMLRELPQPELLYLASLLHDTGKGRASGDHSAVSARLAADVCTRLELGAYETDLVLRLIECHLEMSAALRRDIFNTENVRVFAEKIQTHDLLRMLTLFTYADISAVHPDALTPWKAENLWRLSMAAENQLDRTVDEDRVHAQGSQASRAADTVTRALGRAGPAREALEHFLEGFPERYLRTRSPAVIHQHLLAARGDAPPVLFAKADSVAEITVVGRDRPHLFADLTAVLAGWGMEVVTAEAFSNAQGTVVDSFRFTDTYGTLELNPEERERFVGELGSVLKGEIAPDRLRARRRSHRQKARRTVETRIDFDNTASSHSTLVQIVTRDVSGLLATAAIALSQFACSVEVALIDTEGEVAIDVFYITRSGQQLAPGETQELRTRLTEAIEGNAQ